jgi:hypothetical protein
MTDVAPNRCGEPNRPEGTLALQGGEEVRLTEEMKNITVNSLFRPGMRKSLNLYWELIM